MHRSILATAILVAASGTAYAQGIPAMPARDADALQRPLFAQLPPGSAEAAPVPVREVQKPTAHGPVRHQRSSVQTPPE